MARCFKARDRKTGEVVFLKRVGVGSEHQAALEREADVYARLARMDPPEHVLEVRDLSRGEGALALVTEFADGGDLKHFMDGRGGHGLPAREALSIALEVAQGLQELHRANVVHRDLKPENVLRVGNRWKLADFGIAKDRARAAPGVTFQQAGTLGYAAPEQFDGVPADPSADVYSFGKLLTYLITGTTDPDRIRVDLGDLRRLVHRCAQYVPESRPAVAEVCESLSILQG
jgi:serine/threonine protein kinase